MFPSRFPCASSHRTNAGAGGASVLLVYPHGFLIFVLHHIFLFGCRCLIAEGWVADSAMPEVREALRRGTLRSGASVQTVVNVVTTSEMHPTYFKSTKLTAGFQVGHGRHLQCVP